MVYERIKYPDGQVGAKLIDISAPYEINERINSYEDLFFVKSLVEVLHYRNIKNLHLVIPCLFGQRSDRRFSPFQSLDLKVILDFINSCKFMTVEVLDAHSDLSIGLNHYHKRGVAEFVSKSLDDIRKSIGNKDITLVSPDAGAYKKVFELGQQFGNPVVAAVKHRDLQGKIDLQFIGDVKDKDCLIVDDLCSRGGTFTILSKKLREQGARKIYLYVSHFEGGCEEYKQTIDKLLTQIDGIFTTNSFRDFDENDSKKITIFKVI